MVDLYHQIRSKNFEIQYSCPLAGYTAYTRRHWSAGHRKLAVTGGTVPRQPLYRRHADAVLVNGLGERWPLVVVGQQPDDLGEVLARLLLVLVPTGVQEARDRAHARLDAPEHSSTTAVSDSKI